MGSSMDDKIPPAGESFIGEETAWRRDEVVKRMLSTPPPAAREGRAG